MANLQLSQYADPRGDVDIDSYISGYFDGEGCFTVSFSPRRKLRTGWEVRPSVSVSQNEDRSEVIELVMLRFGCGAIRRDPSDHTVKWEIRSLHPILDNVLPHFERYPLLSSKQHDVEAFMAICKLMERKAHLDTDGLVEIVDHASRMNPSGKRRYSIETIRSSTMR
jgi:hypothetical protein